jgi:bifunctional oligoribonuclease and PAP phosphatase NrnA
VKIPPKLMSFLKEEEKFFIATHISPEADAIGSSLALSMALESLGKVTVVFDKDPVPKFCHFLPGYGKFTNVISPFLTSDFALILLDCNTLKRAGIKGLTFKYSVVIDHHQTEEDFGDIKWVVPEAAATGMMIFYLIKKLGVNITRDMAINLYSAIAIDTGTFRYSNTTAEVLRIAAKLIEAGVSPAHISNNMYETWSQERFALLIMALNTLEVKGNIATTFVTREMYRKTGAVPEDTESFSALIRIMKDVEVSAFFREMDNNCWKVSLRSKGDINVALIASWFDGGGHKNAAGYVVKSDLESAKESLLKALLILPSP